MNTESKEQGIEKYLHLYIGCQVEYGYEGRKYIGRLTGKVELSGWEVFNASLPFNIYHKVRTELIKPFLRPLSSLTEEEAIELIRVQHSEKECPILTNIKNVNGIVDFSAKDERMKHSTAFSIGFAGYNPNEFVCLLSKHFDLFNLIENGLAIDSIQSK